MNRTPTYTIYKYTRVPVTMIHDFGSVFGWPLDTPFGLSQCHGHNLWLVCEVALM